MALTGLQIQKLLPKTNCKECGSNTCLAFAMKLAAKQADLSLCPYASDEAKQVLGAASEPPVKKIDIGSDQEVVLGEETVLYRHEKTFVHRTAIAVNINDNDSDSFIQSTLEKVRDYRLERVGEVVRVDLVAVTQKSNEPENFINVAKKAWEIAKRPVILRSADTKALTKAAAAIKDSHGILAPSTPGIAPEIQECATLNNFALAVTALDLNELVKITAQLKENGFNNLLLQFKTCSLSEQFQTNTIARRGAIKDNYKPLGYPYLRFIEVENLFDDTTVAITEIIKYGGVCVLPAFDPAQISALFTLRLNIYTDPQKPIQVEPKIYPIGEPTVTSPVFVTTNFSLTYFIVSGEIENSGISAWLVVPECEGLSVLTAWAAGKFSGSQIAKFIKAMELESQIKTRELIIPGYVAQISGELEESLPGWKVLVGPQEAGDLESFIKVKVH